MNLFYCYILYNKTIDRFYIGHTDDLSRRLIEHNFPIRNRLTYTRKQIGIWELFYTEIFQTKSEAILRELEIKKWKSKIMIKQLVEVVNTS